MKLLPTSLLSILLACIPLVASAQVATVWMERGQLALEEKRYADAEEAFEYILERDRDNSEVRYLLAQAQLRQGKLKDADRSIVRALRNEPENVSYMELQLEIGFPREPLEILRRTRRDELAVKILAIDPTSVLPNIQLGKSFMNEWLDWRNRLSVQGLAPAQSGWIGETRPSLGSNLAPTGTDRMRRELSEGSAVSGRDPFDLYPYETKGEEIVMLNERAETAYPKSEKHLRRALLTDPKRQIAYLHLARLYVTRPDLEALRKLSINMRKHLPEDFYSWLIAGYAHHYQDDPTVANTHMEKALELMPDSIRTVFEDVDRLMNKEGLKEKKNNPDFNVEAFWDHRDPRRLSPENERLTDHYARILYSDLIFSEPKLDLIGWDSDRGSVYIRYGQPNLEFFMSNVVADCGPNTYDHFHILQYPQGRFVFGNLTPQLNEFVYYSPCAQVVSSRDGVGANSDYTIIAKNNIYYNPEVFNYEAAGKRITFPSLASRFKGRNGKTDIYVPYGIPVEFNALEMSLSLDIKTGSFLLSDGDGVIDSHEKSRLKIHMREVTNFAGATLWMDSHYLEADPGNYVLSVEFETDSDAGVGFNREPVEVPNFSDNELMLSDLLLAYGSEDVIPGEDPLEGTIVRDGLMIKPAPWGVFSNQIPFYLYFEMYNLRRDVDGKSKYSIETVLVEHRDEKGLAKILKRAFKGRAKEGVSVRFEGSSDLPDASQNLILDTEGQNPGTYVLVVRVTDLIANKTEEVRRTVMIE